MHMTADVRDMEQGHAMGTLAIRPCSKVLVFSDADSRCLGIC